MITILPHPAGAVLLVKAQPGARKNALVGAHNGMLKLAVTAAPERGKANKALIALLADLLQLKKAQVSLLSGETSSEKRFLIEGVQAEALSARLASLVV